jgi:hypothetical protein
MCAKRVLARGDIDGAIPDYGVVLDSVRITFS